MNYRKLLKQLPKGFANEADAMSDTDLHAAIIQCEANIDAAEKAKENDEKLKALREQMSDLASGYSDAIKTQRAKIKYMLMRLDEGGKLPEADEEG